MARKSNHYLKRRGERWHYYRRVPKKFAEIDPRGTIRIALNTDSVLVAREKRDRLAEADEVLWRSSYAGLSGLDVDLNSTRQRHKLAQARALALGFSFKPITELVASDNIVDLVERVEAVAEADDQVSEAKVLLGTIEVPKVTIREALELFLTTLTVGERKGKSPDQLRKWRLPRQRAIEHFVSLCGNLPMDEIERSHARKFYEWWGERLSPLDGSKGMKPNSANRDLGNLRKLYRSYWTYEGQEDRRNPFRELRFSDTDSEPTPAFSDEWVRTKILAPEELSGLHPPAQFQRKSRIEN